MSISAIGRPQRWRFSLFCLLLGIVSGLSQPVISCYGSFHFLQMTKSRNILPCIFIINQLHADFITQWDSFFKLKIGASGSYCKARQPLLQRGAIITK